MPQFDADLVVVGGGPAGLATALHARRAGMSVIVVEPRSSPVYREPPRKTATSMSRPVKRTIAPRPANPPGIRPAHEAGCTNV